VDNPPAAAPPVAEVGSSTVLPPPAAIPEAGTAIPAPAPTGGAVLARLKQAREALERKEGAAAMAIYEEVIAAAGDRADILLTISGDLGVTGHTREIIELIGPRYDAQRHGPAAGINLLQAYLAVRDPEAAQHVLDLLFALQRPELEERLLGFSNVISDMLLLGAEGAIAPTPPADAAEDDAGVKLELVSISKPVWFYGLEDIAGLLPPKEGKLRRVAFGQLALRGLKDFAEVMKRPEDELGRLSRGIPLWLSEMLFFSANYTSITAVPLRGREHYVLFNAEWAPEHMRQLVETVEGGLDYVFTGALEQKHADYELVLRLWEVKKFRERKAFTVRWTPATADEALAQFHTQLCAFMEFRPYPAGQGLVYAPPASLRGYVEALGAGLTLFLSEKKVLPLTQVALPADVAARLAAMAAQSEFASLLALGLRARARRLGLGETMPPPVVAATAAVEQAGKKLEA
jgi:hypothetical protein